MLAHRNGRVCQEHLQQRMSRFSGGISSDANTVNIRQKNERHIRESSLTASGQRYRQGDSAALLAFHYFIDKWADK